MQPQREAEEEAVEAVLVLAPVPAREAEEPAAVRKIPTKAGMQKKKETNKM